MSTGRFSDKTFLITGASSGIGLATARLLASEGARIIGIGRDEAKLATAMASLSGAHHLFRAVDVTVEASAIEAIDTLRKSSGPIHGGVCCAGAHALRPFSISKAENFEEMYRANVLSAVNTIRPTVKSAPPGGASFVLVSSVAALRASSAISAYAAAKGALPALGRALALEYAAKKIRFNTVLPGLVDTPMSESFMGKLTPEQREAAAKVYPLGTGLPADVAAAIAFLLSDEARWITGTELVVDGGLSCR